MELAELSLALIGIGIVFMLLAVLKTRSILMLLKEKTEINSWRILFFMMVFFLAGYVAALYLILAGHQKLIAFLTGIVFLLGAVFVFIITRVSSVTINDLILKDKSDELNIELKKNEVVINQKSEALEKVNKELEDERKQLENKIQERTSELKSVNLKLSNEIIEHKKSEQELAENKNRLERQNRALNKVTKCFELDNENLEKSILKVTEISSETIEVERVCVWLYDELKTSIRCIDLYERSKKKHSDGMVLSSENYQTYFKSLELNRVIDASDAQIDPRTREYAELYLKPLGIISMLDAPIRKAGDMIGIVCFEHVGPQRNWTIDEQLFCGAIADSISILLESIERIKAEKILQVKEKQLSSIYDTVGDSIFVITPEKDGRYKFVSVNKVFELTTGINSNQVLGKYVDEIIPQPSLNIVLDKYKSAILEKKIIRWEEVSNYPTGQLIGEVSIAPIFDENNICTFLVGSVHDISDRKKIEIKIQKLNEELEERVKARTSELVKTQESLKLSEEKYRKIVEEVGDVVYSSDYNGNFIYVNPTCKRLTGYEDKELLGKNYLEIIAPEWKEKVKKFYKEQFDEKKQETLYSFPIITKTGEQKWVEQIVTQQHDGDKVIGHHAIVRDITERKIYEEKLKEYQYFFNNSNDLISIANDRNYFEIINPTFQKVLGYSEKELLEKQFLDYIHPDDINPTLQEIEKLKTGVPSINFTNRYRKKDGNYLLLEWNSNTDPVTGKFYAVARDITEKKKAEDDLKNSNERFLKIFQNNAIGMVLVNLETNKFQDANEFFIKKFGYTKEEVIGKTSTEIKIIEPESYEKVLTLLKQQGYVKDFEALVRKKNGETFWSISSIQPMKINNENFFLSSFFDITELKKVESEVKRKSVELELSNKELKYSEQQIQSIFDSAPDAVIVINHESKVLKWNHKAEKLFGWKESEIIGKPLNEFIIPERYRERHLNGMKHYLITGEGPVLNKDIEMEAVNRKGNEFSVRLSISPVGIKNEKLFIGFVRDITEKKKSEKLIIQKTEELERSNKELEQFAYIASHDLQEPLRMVNSYLQLLEKRYKDKLDKDANDFINFAVDGSNRMRTLITSLLDYSRVNRVKPFEDINLNELLKEVLGDLKAAITESKAVITIEPLPVIFADKVLMGQLFQNLISNAVKFKGDKNPEILISGKKNADEYLFSVKDNGIGIQKEYASKLFIIFQRLNTKDQYPGTGIGLAICKKIVERHGGKIWFESEFGKGATFYFTIKELKEQKEMEEKKENPKEEIKKLTMSI